MLDPALREDTTTPSSPRARPANAYEFESKTDISLHPLAESAGEGQPGRGIKGGGREDMAAAAPPPAQADDSDE